MNAEGRALAVAAERLTGVPFRPGGHDPATGLDCLGLVGAALAAIRREVALPASYTLRQRNIAQFMGLLEVAGLCDADRPLRPGDVVLTRPCAVQHHLLIATTGACFVHAHAGLGRVVTTPGPLPWPVLRVWRISTR